MTRWIAALLALAACGDNIRGVALDDYATAHREAECERLVRCGVVATLDACMQFTPISLDPALRQAIADDLVRYDELAARACNAALAELACDATSEAGRVLPPACERVLRGRVGDGAACAFDAECVSGSCDAPLCGRETCCPGTCRATFTDAPIDGACEQDADCVGGAFCGDDMVCHALLAERDMCARDEECGYDLACIGATELQLGRCRDLPLLDEACPYMRCAEIGARCVAGACVPLALPDASCANDGDCSPLAWCDLQEGRCADLPARGALCSARCEAGAWCNAGTCTAPLGDGEPCTASNQCESTFCFEGPLFDVCQQPALCL